MKLDKTSEFASWVIDLRDGVLQVQRVFEFPDRLLLNCFMIEAQRCMERSDLAVTVDLAHDAEMSAVVMMSVIPERGPLVAAGGLATLFEELYGRVAKLLQSAA